MIDIKARGLEAVLAEACISEGALRQLKSDFNYYDEYYLTSSGKLVKGFQQEFVKDPYMDLLPIPELRLITYQAGVSLKELEQIFEMSKLPIITRVSKSINLLGFEPILNMDGQPTVLIPIKMDVPTIYNDYQCPFIRQMSDADLPEITELSRTEYSLRYRMVPLMFHECPEACFVYEKEGRILGVTFNKIDCAELYMRQLFVREGYRGEGIGSSLRKRRLQFAREHGLVSARANIRDEIEGFYKKFKTWVDEENIECYVIKGV